jgi:rfaE bifunctional protein kinase chain/domain
MSKILVVGESMMDHYWRGNSYRKNPESNAPLIKVEKDTWHVGGAANVAYSINKLRSEVSLCSWAGRDEAGQKLVIALNGVGVDTSLIKLDGKTIQKMRVFNGDDYVARVDHDYIPELDPFEELAEALILSSKIEKRIKEFDVCVISDYGKGRLSEALCLQLIDICKENGVFIMCDPKRDNLDKYYGCDLITPNLAELRELTSKDSLEEGAATILETVQNLLLTQSENGMSLINKNGRKDWPALAKKDEIRSCVGCGDGVVAGIAHFIANGKSLEESIDLINPMIAEAMKQEGTISI